MSFLYEIKHCYPLKTPSNLFLTLKILSFLKKKHMHMGLYNVIFYIPFKALLSLYLCMSFVYPELTFICTTLTLWYPYCETCFIWYEKKAGKNNRPPCTSQTIRWILLVYSGKIYFVPANDDNKSNSAYIGYCCHGYGNKRTMIRKLWLSRFVI